MSENTQILVLGAGELGMAVLRNLARRAALFPGTTLTVLLRPSSITSHDPSKQRDITELHSRGVKFLAGDLVAASTTDLSDRFRRFHTVIGCTGFVAGRSVQLKLARAALGAGVQRYFPWQFGVDSVLDRKVRRVERSVPVLKDELAKDPIKKYRVVFAEGKGVSWDVGNTFNAQRGIEVLSVEQWAREHLI